MKEKYEFPLIHAANANAGFEGTGLSRHTFTFGHSVMALAHAVLLRSRYTLLLGSTSVLGPVLALAPDLVRCGTLFHWVDARTSKGSLYGYFQGHSTRRAFLIFSDSRNLIIIDISFSNKSLEGKKLLDDLQYFMVNSSTHHPSCD